MCEVVVAEFLKSELREEVREAIDGSLRQLFGEDVEGRAFAVRSSAAGMESKMVRSNHYLFIYLFIYSLICSFFEVSHVKLLH